ncbi:MAG TPA: (Fe-S)-binding protein, partial [Nitrospirota bacterium]
MKRVRPEPASHALLEQYRQDISRCVKCGSCGAVCPPAILERSESLSARGRMALIKAVLDKKLTISSIFKDRLATCTSCLACEASCPSNVPVTGIIEAAKQEAVRESGLGFINRVVSSSLKSDVTVRTLAWLAPFVLHYSGGILKGKSPGTSGLRLGSGLAAKAKARGRVALFPGCAINHF